MASNFFSFNIFKLPIFRGGGKLEFLSNKVCAQATSESASANPATATEATATENSTTSTAAPTTTTVTATPSPSPTKVHCCYYQNHSDGTISAWYCLPVSVQDCEDVGGTEYPDFKTCDDAKCGFKCGDGTVQITIGEQCEPPGSTNNASCPLITGTDPDLPTRWDCDQNCHCYEPAD